MVTITSFRHLLIACLGLSASVVSAQDPPIPDDVDPKTTTASGLQYSVLKKGDSTESPAMGDRVKVHYTGWLTNGTVFDSSRKRGQPSEFFLGEVVAGWNEGLQLMTVGSRFKFTIPADLAYGTQGSPPTIPADATLIFDVELLSFDVMPKFRKLDADATKTTESGLKYQILEPGTGDSPKVDDPLEFELAFWSTEGQLLHMSARQGQTMKARASDMQLPVLKEAFALMKKGARFVFEVPPALAFKDQPQGPLPPNSVTIWELRLINVFEPLPVPDFAMPADQVVQTTASGLKYEVLKAGDPNGTSPSMGQNVKVHYAGWLTDGTLFDSSFGRGSPAEFMLGRVIRGWNEGLALMKPGAVYRFVIPPGLGYGPQGSPPKIGPDATLVFHIELLK